MKITKKKILLKSLLIKLKIVITKTTTRMKILIKILFFIKVRICKQQQKIYKLHLLNQIILTITIINNYHIYNCNKKINKKIQL